MEHEKLPTCPHCQQVIEKLEWAVQDIPNAKLYLFFCPGCRYALNAQIIEKVKDENDNRN